MATLRKGHSLREKSKTSLIVKLRGIQQVVGPLAKLSRDARTEETSEEDCKRAILNITGEDAAILLTAAGEKDRDGHLGEDSCGVKS